MPVFCTLRGVVVYRITHAKLFGLMQDLLIFTCTSRATALNVYSEKCMVEKVYVVDENLCLTRVRVARFIWNKY